MERVEPLKGTDWAKAYWALVKPGIIFGNLTTAAGGFALASRGDLAFGLLGITLLGLALVIASGCAFNNYIDRTTDQKMARTQNRPLARGIVSPKSAALFALFLGVSGTALLLFYVNLLAALVSLLGFAVYVFFYSFLKYKTVHATLIGSIAGATPPVVGYCAVTHQLDLGALLLFFLLVFWQMPHFFAIALYRLDDYRAASIPVLPLKRGVSRTKVQMLLYVIAFIGVALLFPLFHYTGVVYTIVAAALGAAWLWLAIRGIKTGDDRVWARKMFLFSLVVITTLCGVLF